MISLPAFNVAAVNISSIEVPFAGGRTRRSDENDISFQSAIYNATGFWRRHENRGRLAGFCDDEALFVAVSAKIMIVVSAEEAFNVEIPNKKLFYRFLTSHFA
ncbi:hypothetical protein ABUK73_11990 [Agrobacterium sp. BA1120]|uniref:hypothetical protein n=1 Tax=Agrobacterium sp. BA1120 TaxID=3228927 RepID=UPI00336AA91B